MKSINIPDQINEDLVYLAAIISGDGTMTKYFIKITDSQKINVEYLQKLFCKVFQINSRISQETNNKWILEIDSKLLVNYIKTTFGIPIGSKSKILKVPEIIMCVAKKK